MKYAFSLLLGLGVLLGASAQAAPGSGPITLQSTPAVQKADWDDWGYRRPWYRRHHWGWYRHHHWRYHRYYDGRW